MENLFTTDSQSFLCVPLCDLCASVVKPSLVFLLLLFFFSSLAAAKPITISTNFAGGALGKIEQVTATHFRCGVKGESDQDGRNRQANWYFFRVDGVKGKPLTIEMVDLPGEYNYRPNRGAVTGDTLPWLSEDNQHWRQLEAAEYQADVPLLRLRLTPRAA